MTGPCTHWYGATATRCGAVPARHYLPGMRCPAHTPAALAGQPEPTGQYCAPKRCYCGDCPWWTPVNHYPGLSDSWVTDARAIASGKRRSSPEQYAAAKATVAEQQERNRRLRSSS
ncbi:hypothetical protein ACIBG7_15105 [Nonomuraea sp. NPDC050328]|uniref:hypothetical protein n=1 Tax=Nonomuraea sp. NPDC050328 TaxID=3364361 RepID=UPI0037949312